jgi:hypothetical protein
MLASFYQNYNKSIIIIIIIIISPHDSHWNNKPKEVNGPVDHIQDGQYLQKVTTIIRIKAVVVETTSRRNTPLPYIW